MSKMIKYMCIIYKMTLKIDLTNNTIAFHCVEFIISEKLVGITKWHQN